MNLGIEKISRRGDGENNLVYLQGEEMDNPWEVVGEVPQMTEVGMDDEAKEEEGDETDEDTISVTDSSTPGEPGRGDGAGGPPGGGGPPEDPDNFPEGGRTS